MERPTMYAMLISVLILIGHAECISELTPWGFVEEDVTIPSPSPSPSGSHEYKQDAVMPSPSPSPSHDNKENGVIPSPSPSPSLSPSSLPSPSPTHNNKQDGVIPSPSPSPSLSPSTSSSPSPSPIHGSKEDGVIPSPSPSLSPSPATATSPSSSPSGSEGHREDAATPSPSPSPVRRRRARHDPARRDFCSRAVTTQSCPTPHARDEFDVDEYLGRWYEIGATAQFKFQYEPGLICERARHSLLVRNHEDYGAVVALLNRGQPVLKPFQAAAVSHLSQAAHDVCNHARAICNIIAPHSAYSDSLEKLVSTVHSIRNDSVMRYRHELESLSPSARQMQSLRRNITILADRLSRGMTRLQYINGNMSQGVGHPETNVDALMDLSSTLKDTIGVLNLRIGEVAPNVKAEVLRDAVFLRPESISLSVRLAEAVVAVDNELEKVQAQLVDITALLSAVTDSARAYYVEAPPYNWNPVEYPIAESRGVAVQNPDAEGKFEVHQYGLQAPYWVLDVDVANGTDGVNGTDAVNGDGGGNGTSTYDAALIYSCTEQKEGPPHEKLFVLSRSMNLSDATISRFSSTASRYRVYTDCENPFIYTVQSRHSCTSWPF